MKLCFWPTNSDKVISFSCFKVAIKLLNIRNGWRRSRQREWISCIQVNIYRHMGIKCTFTFLYNWSVAKVFCHIQSTQLHPIMRQYRRNLLLSRIWQFINEGYETQMIFVRIRISLIFDIHRLCRTSLLEQLFRKTDQALPALGTNLHRHQRGNWTKY